MNSKESIVELAQVQATLGTHQGRQVRLKIDTLELDARDQVALIGPSGCGKSSVLRVLCGLIPADSGTLQVCGEDLRSKSPSALDKFRGRHVGMIEQTFHLLDDFSALDNLLVAARFGRRLSASAARARSLELLDRVGLSDSSTALPRALSVGERQRVAIARALVNGPELILADEPTAALDRNNAERVADLIGELCESNDAALVFVTHDPDLAERFPRRVDANQLVEVA